MNYDETKELLKQYLLARIPYITFDTIEKYTKIPKKFYLGKISVSISVK